jgi:hypothetical protein
MVERVALAAVLLIVAAVLRFPAVRFALDGSGMMPRLGIFG